MLRIKLSFSIILLLFFASCTLSTEGLARLVESDGDADTDVDIDGDFHLPDSDADADSDRDVDIREDVDPDEGADVDPDVTCEADASIGTPCDGDDDDECEDGIFVCKDGVTFCDDDELSSNETCNGEDDNCDNLIDNEAGCPCAVQYFGEHAYLFCNHNRTWVQARDFCIEYGYTLVTINDDEENEFLTERIPDDIDGWIGLNDRAQENRFIWSGTGEGVTYGHWGEWQPNNILNEDCVEIRGDSGNWHDIDCGEAQGFICETE